jgi:transcriptional regulator with XRE-family HTH domain
MEPIDPEDATLLFFWLWSLRDWTDEEMATITDLAPETIQRFEDGEEIPSEATLERVTAAVGLPIPFIHTILLPMFRMARHVMGGMRPAPSESAEARAAKIGAEVGEAARLAILDYFSETEAALRNEEPTSPIEALRPKRERGATNVLDPNFLRGQRAVAERLEALWQWELEDLSDRMAAKSEATDEVEDDDEDEEEPEVATAESQERAAEARSKRISRVRAQGYAEAFVSNAQRMVATFSRAADFLRLVCDLWDSDDPARLHLEERRLAEIDTAIREGRKRFEEALELLDCAAVLPPQPAPVLSVDPKARVN